MKASTFNEERNGNYYPASNYKEIRLRSGAVIEQGTDVIISIPRDQPHRAKVYYSKEEPEKFFICSSLSLYKYFMEFIEITHETLADSFYDSLCPSLLGDEVEPDGYDPHGFPSVLRAALMI